MNPLVVKALPMPAVVGGPTPNGGVLVEASVRHERLADVRRGATWRPDTADGLALLAAGRCDVHVVIDHRLHGTVDVYVALEAFPCES